MLENGQPFNPAIFDSLNWYHSLIPESVYRDKDLSAEAKLIAGRLFAIYYEYYEDDEDESFDGFTKTPSTNVLAKELGLTRIDVEIAITEIEEAHYIVLKDSKFTCFFDSTDFDKFKVDA